MKKRGLTIILIVLMTLVLSEPACAKTLYVDNREKDKQYPERLNLRAEPTTQSGVLAFLPRGAAVKLREEGNEWSRVYYQGHTGYVMTR